MTVPDPSGEQKARDEAAFTAALNEAMAASDRRQAQSAGFMDREAPGDVDAGAEQLGRRASG